MNYEKVRIICDRLAVEPVFHMSLHSKELFHSNVLAWFCEAFPHEAHVVFSRWVPARETSIHKVQREHQHLDLVVEIPGLSPVIIENKVFSPPDDEQLDRYSSGALTGLDDPSCVLLSLGDPNWEQAVFTSTSGMTWRHVSYRDLADALSEVVTSIEGFAGDVLRHYVAFITSLQELVDEIGNPGRDDSIDLDPKSREMLQRIRLFDAIGKLRTRSASASLQRAVRPFLGAAEVKFDANFTNAQPLMEAFLQCRNGDRIGWQYQGQQWRLAIITQTHSGRTSELRDKRHVSVGKRYASWFDFSSIPDLIGRQVSEVPKLESSGGFNGYNPDFVYRYRKLPNLNLSELEVLSQHYLTIALNWTS